MGRVTDSALCRITDALSSRITTMNTSSQIDEDEGKELLQSTYLIQVKDSAGERSFELYTASNLKGNKGKYYSNDCIYALVQ